MQLLRTMVIDQWSHYVKQLESGRQGLGSPEEQLDTRIKVPKFQRNGK